MNLNLKTFETQIFISMLDAVNSSSSARDLVSRVEGDIEVFRELSADQRLRLLFTSTERYSSLPRLCNDIRQHFDGNRHSPHYSNEHVFSILSYPFVYDLAKQAYDLAESGYTLRQLFVDLSVNIPTFIASFETADHFCRQHSVPSRDLHFLNRYLAKGNLAGSNANISRGVYDRTIK